MHTRIPHGQATSLVMVFVGQSRREYCVSYSFFWMAHGWPIASLSHLRSTTELEHPVRLTLHQQWQFTALLNSLLLHSHKLC